MDEWKPEGFKRCENDMLSKFEDVYYKHRDSRTVNIIEKLKSQEVRKDNNHAAILRKKGNEFLEERNCRDAIKFYSKSLSFACYDTEEWCLALINRSSALYAYKEYMDCLRDIDCLLNNNYLNCDRKLQILIRKCKCYAKILNVKSLENEIKQLQMFCLENNINRRDVGIDEIWKIYHKSKDKDTLMNFAYIYMVQMERYILEAKQNFEPNSIFLHASEAVKLCFDNKRGRHVRASRNILQGEILFMEPAFSVANVFDEGESLMNKCSHCLKHTYSLVPCKKCRMVYCSDRCIMLAWDSYHKFECRGMPSFWYEMGPGLLAFRSMLKGIPSGFDCSGSDIKQQVTKFGDGVDNYRYFNTLQALGVHEGNRKSSDVDEDVLLYVLDIILYLENFTNFFNWLTEQPNSPKLDQKNLIIFIGARIYKHFRQIQSNATSINYIGEQHKLNPFDVQTVATAFYPAYCMMNHSCDSNISVMHCKNVVIVKALHHIAADKEIFNCYGPRRSKDRRESRQNELLTLYKFHCECEACEDPLGDDFIDDYEIYKCPDCEGLAVPSKNGKLELQCRNCHKKYNKELFLEKLAVIQKSMEKCIKSKLSPMESVIKLKKIIEELEEILNKNHFFLQKAYHRLFRFLLKVQDYENAIVHARRVSNIVGRICGFYSYKFVCMEESIVSDILKESIDTNFSIERWRPSLERMILEVRDTLKIHFPTYYLETYKSLKYISKDNKLHLRNGVPYVPK